MEQMVAQMMQQRLAAAMPQGNGRTGRSALTAQAGGDPFMQIIQNIVDQMMAVQEEMSEGSKRDSLDEILLAGFAGMLHTTPAMALLEETGELSTSQSVMAPLEETGVPGASQGAVLLQQLTMQTQGTERLKTVPEAVRALLLQATGQTEQLTDTAQVATDSQPKIPTVMQATAKVVQPPVMERVQVNAQTELLAAQTLTDLRPKQSAQSRTVLQAARTEQLSREEQMQAVSTQSQNRESESLFDGQQRFGGAVAQAKQMLRSQGRESEQTAKTETELVEFQQVAQKVTLPTATTVAKPQEAQTPRLLDQLSDGLTRELDAGKSEFTMKLKPEALGEITVKLTEKAGKMVVSITTASVQTAKLLNAEMPGLRETMRPMQVEVHEAVSQSSQSNQAQMQFNMSGQQFANQQRAFAWQQEKPYYAGGTGQDLLEETDETTQYTRTPESAGLNLYV